MKTPQSIKLQLVQEIIDLPDGLLLQVSDFINSLLSQYNNASKNGDYSSGRDPMLDYIGGVSYEPPTKSIDEELYG